MRFPLQCVPPATPAISPHRVGHSNVAKLTTRFSLAGKALPHSRTVLDNRRDLLAGTHKRENRTL